MKLQHFLIVSKTAEDEQSLFDWTLTLAKRYNAKITVLRVLPEIDQGLFAWLQSVEQGDILENKAQEARYELEGWVLRAQQAGVVLQTQIEFGKTFYKAIQQVLKGAVDLVLKQSDEDAPELCMHIFGSDDLHLLRKCPCPVLLYKKSKHKSFSNVMASIDVNTELDSQQPDDFNQAILEMAREVTAISCASLKVVHAWQADAESLVRYWGSDLSHEDLIRYLESERKHHANALEHDLELSRSLFPSLEVIMPKGRAVDAIPLAVQENQIDLLVMGTVGRNGLPGIIIGNTSETILEKVNCSVLALKPKNFVSPITL